MLPQIDDNLSMFIKLFPLSDVSNVSMLDTYECSVWKMMVNA